jgi:hypothetical protein
MLNNKKVPYNKGKKQSDAEKSSLKEKWRNDNTRKCPECSRTIIHKTYEGYWMGIKNNSRCMFCVHSGENNAQYGVRHDKEYKHRMSLKLSGEKNPMYGLMGDKHPAFGYKHTDETKEIIRQKVCERMKRNKCLPDVDCGATEYFNTLNASGGLSIEHPNIYLPCGYFADGYDRLNHIIYEYDTAHHKKLKNVRKDKIRQDNIITYFEKIGKPLNKFIRIKAYDNHKIEVVYENNN